MVENIYRKLQHLSDIHHFTGSGAFSKATVSLWAEHFLLLHMSCGWLQDCTSGRFINVAAEQTDGMTDHGSHSSHTEHCCDSSLVVILQHNVVLWLKGTAVHWVQMFKINLLSKWSGRRQALLLLLLFPLTPLTQTRYELGFSSILLLHIISVNMSALSHCQVGDKQEWNDNRDCVIVEFPTCVTIYVLKSVL
jgi:hypothetical protein